MNTSIIVNIPTVDNRILWLKSKSNAALLEVGDKTIIRQQDAWAAGVDGLGKTMPKLSKVYAAYKAKRGRTPMRDFFFRGRLWASMYVRKLSDLKFSVTFRASQEKKAVSNAAKVPGMMKIPITWVYAMTDLFYKRMRSNT
jgi:hypothetical protein